MDILRHIFFVHETILKLMPHIDRWLLQSNYKKIVFLNKTKEKILFNTLIVFKYFMYVHCYTQSKHIYTLHIIAQQNIMY